MKNKEWIKITVEIPSDMVDEISELLIESGSSQGVEVVNFPDSTKLIGYFQKHTIEDLLSLEEKIKAVKRTNKEISFHLEPFMDEDWSKNWKLFFKTVSISDKLLIIPEWEKEKLKNDSRELIVLTPGMAFGTGYHETTRGALESIVSLCSSKVPKKMLDVGCGSGILSIAGSLLGIKDMTAFDIDPDVMGIARKNLSVNGLDGKVKLFAGEIGALKGRYDLIVANIISDVLKKIREDIRSHMAKGGFLILSGILEEHEARVKHVYISHPLMSFVERKKIGEWVTLVFKKVALPQKHPCPECDFCQFCSDSRCSVCMVRPK